MSDRDRSSGGGLGIMGITIWGGLLASCLPQVHAMPNYNESVERISSAQLGTIATVNSETILGGDGVAIVSAPRDSQGCTQILSLRLQRDFKAAGDAPTYIYNQGIGFGRDLRFTANADGTFKAGDIDFLRRNFTDRTHGMDAVVEQRVCNGQVTWKSTDSQIFFHHW